MKQDSNGNRAILSGALEERRRKNMRQLLLQASRIVNRHVVEGLHARGYTDLRSTHTTLLSNIDLDGSTVTVAADRAGITKQAMGRLADELGSAGYIRVRIDPNDARARVLELTRTGQQLMLDSLEVMAELEHRYARSIGRDPLAAILRGLAAFVEGEARPDADPDTAGRFARPAARKGPSRRPAPSGERGSRKRLKRSSAPA
jgi:DNA-binding MarR family transcriptional regulator